eukprot:m.11907 g.11907  ORF g.11907 m.11907 type:complete len:443 (+) comp2889_c0_seq1:394-1722(+)
MGDSAVASAAAIAEHAGTDTWKTWAGRREGDDGLQVADLFNGVAAGWRHMVRRRKGDVRRSGKTCPVCEDESPEPDAAGKRWLRLYCGCTVCTNCVRGWNLALLDDSGGIATPGMPPKLKCPLCATPMRRVDAIEVLCRIPDVTRKWDIHARNALLRAMPDFRSCPKCAAGGFTTPECLAPRHEEIVAKAISMVAHYRAAVVVMYMAFGALAAREASPAYVGMLAIVVAVAGQWLATAAREASTAAVTAPLSVECPECQADYLLQGYGETLSGERQTDQWIHEHTRPCPACGSPIQKAGGCNAMVCGACRSPFCWACMRAKSACSHFDCTNGSPFADKKTTGGRNGQPLTVNTPATHTAALESLTQWLAAVAITVAMGALLAHMDHAATFWAPHWLAHVTAQVVVFGLRSLLYFAAAAGGGVLLLIMYRAYERRRRTGRWNH